MKDIERVPENRTMDTASATGRTATMGLGQLRRSLVSTPRVIRSLRSTSILAISFPGSSSEGVMRQLEKMGKSSPRETSVTRIESRKSGFCGPFRILSRDFRIASSVRASSRNWARVWAIRTLNQSSDSGWWEWTL